MATKAQLEAELANLKAQMAQTRPEPEPRSEPEEPPVTDAQGAFSALLEDHGIDTSDIDALWRQFSDELKDLPEQKPLVTAVAAFGLGFALGRLSKP